MSKKSQTVIENTLKTIIQHVKEINKPVLDKFDRQQMRRFIFDDFVMRQLKFLYLSGFQEWEEEALDKVHLHHIMKDMEQVFDENIGKTLTKDLSLGIRNDLFFAFQNRLIQKKKDKELSHEQTKQQ